VGNSVGTVAWRYSSVSSTISVDGTALTAFTRLFQATLLSLVSVKYDHGGLNRDGFRTALVLTPLAVAETLDNRPSGLYFRNSSVQVTTVRDGLVSVLHPRLPAEVGALFVGMFCATAVVSAALAHDAPVGIVDCSSIIDVVQILLSISRRLFLQLLVADGLLFS